MFQQKSKNAPVSDYTKF